jgi:hypothetical protein
MREALRPYVAAGIAIIASLIAVTPRHRLGLPTTVTGGDPSADLTNVVAELPPTLF